MTLLRVAIELLVATRVASASVTDSVPTPSPVEAATITGIVRDETTHQPLSGAAVLLPELERGTLTDAEGRYSLPQVPPGPHHLTVRLLGYSPRTLHALMPRRGELTISVSLRPEPVPLKTIE